MRKLLLSISLVLFICSMSFGVERTNLGINGGRANYYAWDNVNQLMYTGVESAMNLFKSADSGQTWELAYPDDSLESGWSNTCNIIRTDGGITVAVVGSGQKIIVTQDGGQTWRQLMTSARLGSLSQTAGIMPPPQGFPNASIRDSTIYVASGCMIFKTTDFGQTWNTMLFPDTTVRGINQNSRMSVADVVSLDSTGLNLLALANAQGSQATVLYRSVDGVTFRPDSILDSSTVINPGDLPRGVKNFNQLLTSPTDRSIVVLAEAVNMSGNWQTRQIWLSRDRGTTWDSLAANGKITTTTVNMQPQQTGLTDLATVYLFEDPDYPNGIRIASGLSYSDNWGATWSRVSNSNGPSLHGFRCHVPGTEVYMAFNEDAPYRCTDTMLWDWKYSAMGMTSVQVNQIAQLPSNLDIVYLATNSGIAITRVYTDTTITDPAEKWLGNNGVFPMQPFGGITSVGTIIISPYDSSIVLAGGGNGIWKAANGGFQKSDWHQDNYRAPAMVGGLSTTFCDNGGTLTSFAWYSPDTVLASISGGGGYGGLLISTDGGDSFSVWNVVPNKSCGKVYVADDSASNARWIFAGFGSRDSVNHVPCMVWRSGDGGVTWDSCMLTGGSTNQPTVNTIYDMACAVGSVDTLFFACEFGVGISTDTGATAHIITFPTTPGPGPQNNTGWEICAIAVDKNDQHKVYAASREEIYLVDWTKHDTISKTLYYASLPGERILDLLFDDLTMGSSAGFFGLSSEQTTAIDVKKNAINVSAPLTMNIKKSLRVNFSLSQRANVNLSLYNAKGVMVQRILNGVCEKGTTTTSIRRDRLAAGTYFLRLKAGKNSITQSVIVLK